MVNKNVVVQIDGLWGVQGKLEGSLAWRDVGLECCGWGYKSHVEVTCVAMEAMEVCLLLAMNIVLVKAGNFEVCAVPTSCN